jgi:hypothetical protein
LHKLKIVKEQIKNHPEKEVKKADLKGSSEIVFEPFEMAPLRRSWVALLRRSLTELRESVGALSCRHMLKVHHYLLLLFAEKTGR